MELTTILLVEDDPTIRKIAGITLSRVGRWKVTLAGSGAEALELIEREKPDLILLDVMMPVMDGPATLKVLRGNPATKEIPVIFLTAKVQQQELEDYCRLGATGVISKPFDPLTLPGLIQNLFDATMNAPCPA